MSYAKKLKEEMKDFENCCLNFNPIFETLFKY